jgi:hypothetical protein
VAVFFFSFAYRFLSFELTNDDYQFFTLGRQMAVYGEWPVRDLVEEGDPLHNVISAALQKTFGYSLFGEVMFDLWMLSAAAALVFVLAADISGSIPLAVLATLLSVLASPRLYDYLKAILPTVAFWLCFRYVDGPSRGKAMAMGLFTALAFLCRHDFGIFIGAASVVTIAAAQITAGSLRPGSFATYAGSALAGVLPYLVFVQLHVGVLSYIDTARQYVNRELSDAPDPRPAFAFDMSRQLWESNPPLDVNVRWAEGVSDELRATLERQYALLDGRKHEGRTWRYFLGDAAPANLRAIVTDPRVEDTSNIFRTIPTAGEPSVRDRVREVLLAPGVAVAPGILTRNNAIAWLYYVLRILPGLAAILLVAAVVRKQPLPAAGLPRALPLLVFCLLAAPLLLRGNMHGNTRLADLMYPSAVLGAWVLAIATGSGCFTRVRSADRIPRRLFRAVGFCVATVALLLTFASVGAFARVVEALDRASVILEPSTLAATVSRRIDDLVASPPPATWLSYETGMRGAVEYLRECTAPRDRVLIYGFHPELLFFSGRASAADRSVLAVGSWTRPADQQRTLLAMRKGNMRLALIDAHPWGPASRSGAFRHDFPLIEAYLRERYRLAATTDFGSSTGLAFDVWVDATRTPGGVYEPFSLPCFR